MMRRVPLVLVLAALFMHGGGLPSAEQKFPDRVWSVLSEADKLEVLSLDPVEDEKAKDTFHGWKVLGKTEVKEKKERDAVASVLKKGIEEARAIANCFEPRHGIRVTKGKQTVDLVICFNCMSIEIYPDGGEKRLGDQVPFATSPEATLDKILRDAGVKLAPKPTKDR
jgi:hypothetical protein